MSIIPPFYYNQLSSIEQQAYDRYKDNPYSLNDALRSGHILQEDNLAMLYTLSNLIEKYHCLKHIELYRAACSDCMDRFIDNQNNLYTYPAFMSTALSARKAASHLKSCFEFHDVFMTLTCSAGTAMMPMDTNPSGGHSEDEMLLATRSVWKVTNQDVLTSKVDIEGILKRPFSYPEVKTLYTFELEFIRYDH